MGDTITLEQGQHAADVAIGSELIPMNIAVVDVGGLSGTRVARTREVVSK